MIMMRIIMIIQITIIILINNNKYDNNNNERTEFRIQSLAMTNERCNHLGYGVITGKYQLHPNVGVQFGRTVGNKGKLILTEIFPSVQKHDI